MHETDSSQNHLSCQKLHLRKRLVVLMLVKTSKLVSKFENPMPGAESPFSQQRRRFLDHLGRNSTCISLLAVECGVHHGCQGTWKHYSYVIKAKKLAQKGSVDERSTHWHLRSANSALITSLAIHSRRLGVGMQYLASAVPQLQHERSGAYQQTKAF